MSYADWTGQVTGIFDHIVPECYIKGITLRGGTGYSPLKVTLSLCVTDIVEDDIISSWMVQSADRDEDTSPFEEFITIHIEQVSHPLLDKMLNQEITAADAMDQGLVLTGKNAQAVLQTQTINLLDNLKQYGGTTGKSSISKFKKKDSFGNLVVEFPVQTTFEVSNNTDPRGVSYLAYYVWTELDLAGMAKKMGIAETYLKKGYRGIITKRVKKELVIQDYNTITYTNLFQTPSGELWQGPKYRMGSAKDPDQGWFTGNGPSLQSEPLTVVSVQNKKIRDFRLVNRVGQKYVSVMNRRRAAGLTGGQDKALTLSEDISIIDTVRNHTKRFSARGAIVEKPAALFSPMWSSTDELHNGNFLFAFNWVPFLKRNCAYPHLWNVSEKTTADLLAIAKILRMKITRTQVDTSHRASNALGTPLLPMKLKNNDLFLETQICETGDINGSAVRINTDRCYLQETKVGLNYSGTDHRQMRWFTLTDRELITQKNGEYQYTISVRALDPTQPFMKQQIAKLQYAKKSLSDYLSLAEGFIKGKPVYDIYLDSFSADFIATVPEDLWYHPVNMYIQVLEAVSGILKQPAYAGASYTLKTALPPALSSYVDPRKGSPEGILSTLKLIDNLEMALNKMTQGAYATSTKFGSKGWVGLGNRTTAGVPKSTPKSISTQKVLEASHTFSTEINLDGQRGMGYDYLTNQTVDFVEDSIKGAGLRTISARYFKKRCMIETQRFYGVVDQSFSWNLLSKEVPSLTLANESTGDSLESTKYSYLSPAFVFSSPGMSLPGVAGFGGSMGSPPPSTPPPPPKAQSPAAKNAAKVSTFATSYALHGGGKPLANAMLLTKNLAPVMLLNQGLSPNAAPSPKTLDDLAVDIAVQQTNPDMSLYPVDVDAYKDPSIHKNTKLSPEEQGLKSKYTGVLGMKGCVMVEEEREFDEIDFHTTRHPAGYNFETTIFGKEKNTFNPETFLQKIKLIGMTQPVWKSSIPMLPASLATTNPLPLFKTLVLSNQGFKSGNSKGHISYNSLHLSNFKLLDFSDTASPNILTQVNPSMQTSVLKDLPNSLKSLALSKQSFVMDDVFTSPQVEAEFLPPPSIYDPKNMQKVYELFYNTVRIEYLDTFIVGEEEEAENGSLEKQKGSEMLLKGPIWKLLNDSKIKEIEASENAVALLCRLSRYKNKELGIGYDKLPLPIIDEYFLMQVDPLKPLVIAPAEVAEEEYVHPSDGTEGEFATGVDPATFGLYPDMSKFRYLDVDGQTLLVKEFDGQVICGDAPDDN